MEIGDLSDIEQLELSDSSENETRIDSSMDCSTQPRLFYEQWFDLSFDFDFGRTFFGNRSENSFVDQVTNAEDTKRARRDDKLRSVSSTFYPDDSDLNRVQFHNKQSGRNEPTHRRTVSLPLVKDSNESIKQKYENIITPFKDEDQSQTTIISPYPPSFDPSISTPRPQPQNVYKPNQGFISHFPPQISNFLSKSSNQTNSSPGISPSKSFSLRKNKSNRGKYRCGRCGQVKTNHVCPVTPELETRATSTQTDPVLSGMKKPFKKSTKNIFEDGDKIIKVSVGVAASVVKSIH